MKSTKSKTKEKIVSIDHVKVGDLKPHPRNYRKHPKDQLDHLVQSIKENGFYRNVVVARDNTILAGHGVVEAATLMKRKTVPVIRLDLGPNDPKALKVLTGDNELPKRAEVDDRELTQLLKEIKDADSLLGTGFDEKMLTALLMNTRPSSEIRNINEAAEWVGMPDYQDGETPIRIVITFMNEKDRKEFVKFAKLKIDKTVGLTWSTRWPFTEREDTSTIRFQTPKKKK